MTEPATRPTADARCVPDARRWRHAHRACAAWPGRERTLGRRPAPHLRLEPVSQPAASQNAAYRRLAAVMLGLDVPTLALELRTARRRLALTESRAA